MYTKIVFKLSKQSRESTESRLKALRLVVMLLHFGLVDICAPSA